MPTKTASVTTIPYRSATRQIEAVHTTVIDGAIWVCYTQYAAQSKTVRSALGKGMTPRAAGYRSMPRHILARLRPDDVSAAHPAWNPDWLSGWRQTTYQQLVRVIERDATTLQPPADEPWGASGEPAFGLPDAAGMARLYARVAAARAALVDAHPVAVRMTGEIAEISHKMFRDSRWDCIRFAGGEARSASGYMLSEWATGMSADSPILDFPGAMLMLATQGDFWPLRWATLAPQDGDPGYLLAQVKLMGAAEAYCVYPAASGAAEPAWHEPFSQGNFDRREEIFGERAYIGVCTVADLRHACKAGGTRTISFHSKPDGRTTPVIFAFRDDGSVRALPVDDDYRMDWVKAQPEDVARIAIHARFIEPLLGSRSVGTPVTVEIGQGIGGGKTHNMPVVRLTVTPGAGVYARALVASMRFDPHHGVDIGVRPDDGWSNE